MVKVELKDISHLKLDSRRAHPWPARTLNLKSPLPYVASVCGQARCSVQ